LFHLYGLPLRSCARLICLGSVVTEFSKSLVSLHRLHRPWLSGPWAGLITQKWTHSVFVSWPSCFGITHHITTSAAWPLRYHSPYCRICTSGAGPSCQRPSSPSCRRTTLSDDTPGTGPHVDCLVSVTHSRSGLNRTVTLAGRCRSHRASQPRWAALRVPRSGTPSRG